MDDVFLLRHYAGSSPEIERVRRAIQFANQPTAIALRQPVILLGESGTGKGYVAELIAAHRYWLELLPNQRPMYLRRRDALTTARYQSVLLPGLPDTLIESELFGHRKGAFTGAVRDHEGVFGSDAVADVLLDEVGDAGLSLQEKLLEVIESGEYRPVGGSLEEKKTTQARLLMATNKDLADLVRQGGFREDLYWRVSQLVIRMPALRDQRENMREIMGSVRQSLVDGIQVVSILDSVRRREFTDADVHWASGHHWPGNIRELARLVRLWLIHPEILPLAEVQAQFPVEDPWNPSGRAERLLESAVDRWCDEVRSGRRTPPGTVDGFLSAMSTGLKRAVLRQELKAGDIQRLFPDQTLANVRIRFSKWKKELAKASEER